MDLSQEWVFHNIVERYGFDYVNEYGEPGYGNFGTQMVILGDFWCKCGKHPHAGQPARGFMSGDGKVIQPDELHDYATHHPRVWSYLEHNGFECEWHDEWVIDYENGKCYRTTGDSYQWTPTAIVTEWGDLLTPDSPLEEWLAWAVNEPTRCLFPKYASKIEEAGFVKAGPDDDESGWGGRGSYEAGWHAGQDADPKEIFANLEHEHDEIVFVLDYNSQFYSGFSVYVRDKVDA